MAETSKFKAWVKMQSARIRGREAEIEKEVENSMCRKNIKVETKNEDGVWEENDEI